jgi:heat shock protein HslJ
MRVLPAFLIVVLLAACGEAAPSDGGDPEGDWVLTRGSVSGQDVPIPDGQPIRLTIDGSAIDGTVCNSFGGRVTSEGGRIRIVDLAQTAMACVDEEIMTAEGLVMAGLAAAEAITVDDEELLIEGPGVELRYVRAGAAGSG